MGTLESLALQLRLCQKLLPLLVRFNGCLNLNLPDTRNPLQKMAQELNIPPLAELDTLRYVWDTEAFNSEWDDASAERFDATLDRVQAMVETRLQSYVPSSSGGTPPQQASS